MPSLQYVVAWSPATSSEGMLGRSVQGQGGEQPFDRALEPPAISEPVQCVRISNLSRQLRLEWWDRHVLAAANYCRSDVEVVP